MIRMISAEIAHALNEEVRSQVNAGKYTPWAVQDVVEAAGFYYVVRHAWRDPNVALCARGTEHVVVDFNSGWFSADADMALTIWLDDDRAAPEDCDEYEDYPDLPEYDEDDDVVIPAREEVQ